MRAVLPQIPRQRRIDIAKRTDVLRQLIKDSVSADVQQPIAVAVEDAGNEHPTADRNIDEVPVPASAGANEALADLIAGALIAEQRESRGPGSGEALITQNRRRAA